MEVVFGDRELMEVVLGDGQGVEGSVWGWGDDGG